VLSIALVAAAAAFILRSERQLAGRDERLVAAALERAALISRTRMDAQALDSAVEAQIRAPGATERAEAAALVGAIIQNLKASREAFAKLLPNMDAGQRATWERFEQTSLTLAARVQEAERPSDTRKAEAERLHLIGDLLPLLADLDGLADSLAQMNAHEAPEILRRLDVHRMNNVTWGADVLFGAVIAALALGMAMSSILRRQDVTIERQLVELDERNRELDAFAGRVAHDLISPLAPLKGHLTVARRSEPARADPAVVEHLRKAEESVDRLAGLVEALLRFCRSGSPSEGPAAALDAVVNAQLMEVAQTAAAHAVDVQRDIGKSVVVDCPAQLLQCIAQNLLSNAVKYSAGRTDARVRVRVYSDGAFGVLEVLDNGQGIAPELLKELGRPFLRAKTAHHQPGYGLGLATTLRLLQAHGGSLSLGQAPGGGTAAMARLPLRRAEASA
jgi:two-component system OmpR family sensor kinase